MSGCPLDAGSEQGDFGILVDEVVYEMRDGVISCEPGEGVSLFCPRSIVCLGGRGLLVAVVGSGSGWVQDRVFVSACLPSSVELLCDSCFRRREALLSVTFEPGCKLSRIEACAFSSCSSLS
jgi:hypothetical protein